ncbi:LuxR C-terminal-related transcriptional regulator [Ectopseudomonas hydrolytica]|uniref:LuxR C-terminal-related transcriptional regulator n=1 Tax=Ectopseudomonas hydrolytica TaxID=2493633 RepID=A0ABY5A6H9_9GAMM|nr:MULTISPECIES: LuxR C-terminal-related transcriptional regulator [Pseudomonas]ARS50467.1 LuxR family transcriptional regulator [Pseudomonas mendocina]EJO95666.1 regulatory protein LuxR [Pseudomonas mendocina DLHK]MBA4244646.1 HTH-type transcriptional regulator MalT [Pseudomonas sp.]USR39001.1 LuxR C-terminal-related transcriptional regulator [Pseudomonas hydrolytica]
MTDLSRSPGFPYAPASPVEARFYRPPLPAGHVPRPRLCQRLEEGLQGRLLLVCAPAGFGKSSLAIEFCEGLPEHWHSLWLGLSERDQDPGRFLERLLQGLQQFYPALGEEALGLLKMRQRHQPFAFEQWLDGLLDELADELDDGQPLLLVLDDYHLAQGPVLDRCLQFFLNHLPPGVLLLVTSRQRPDWHLARLRLSRQLLELNEQDLRLTTGEVDALLSSQGARLQRPQVADILQRSEGWVAGLRLWLLAVEELDGDAQEDLALHGGEGLIREYLLEEVIERQPPEVQQFLYETACLERFCAGLCDAVRDSHDSAAIIRQLQANQVFLVPLDEQGQWFRYHHLFSDLLNARSLEGQVRSQGGAHLRACRWFAAQGMLDSAIEQALLAGQADVAASLVQNLSEEQMLAEQNIAMLLRWKTNLPDDLLASTPRLIMLYGWALALACQLDAAQELLEQLGRFLPAADPLGQRSLLAQWQALDGVIARGRGDGARAEQQCSEALAGLPAERYGPHFMCLSTLANLAMVRGDLWRARGLNREALELAQRIDNPLFEALAHYERARVLQARGEVLRALSEVRQGLAHLQGLPVQRSYSVRARLTLYEGYLLSLRLQPRAAEQLQAGIAEARSCRDVGVLIGYCVLACLEGRRGRPAEAFALLGEAERLMHVWDVPAIYYLAMITLIKCELWLRQGQVELAAAWLPQLAETYGDQGRALAPEFHPQLALHIDLQQAALERLQGDVEAAERRLRALQQQAQGLGGQLVGLMAQAQLAQLLRQTGREREAQQQLDGCLEVAQGGALLPFVELLEHQPQWLRERLQLRPACPQRDALLAQLPAAREADEDVAPEESGPTEKLSGREMAVLQLIARGCSNQEISERLFISLHTVKTHARHINSKLGVERRTQAVARAKGLGLLR